MKASGNTTADMVKKHERQILLLMLSEICNKVLKKEEYQSNGNWA